MTLGSDALLMARGSACADDARLQKVKFASSIHLSFDELQLGDLALGLTVGPGRGNRSADRSFVFDDAIGERLKAVATISTPARIAAA